MFFFFKTLVKYWYIGTYMQALLYEITYFSHLIPTD